jgi:hypothetical protein
LPILLALSVALITGCGGGDAERQQIDEQKGTYRGVGLGSTGPEVIEVFGKSPPLKQEAVTPTGRDVTEINFAPSSSCPPSGNEPRQRGRGAHFRYKDVAFQLTDHVVCHVTIIEDDAATSRGVAIGDPLDDVEEDYPHLRCGEAEIGEGGAFPVCAGQVAENRYIWFGGDPINTIEMNPLPSLFRCGIGCGGITLDGEEQ